MPDNEYNEALKWWNEKKLIVDSDDEGKMKVKETEPNPQGIAAYMDALPPPPKKMGPLTKEVFDEFCKGAFGDPVWTFPTGGILEINGEPIEVKAGEGLSLKDDSVVKETFDPSLMAAWIEEKECKCHPPSHQCFRCKMLKFFSEEDHDA